jgi:Tol biopolymer transport system component
MKSLRRSIGDVLVCIVGCATMSWAQSGFTLEQVLSAPFSGDLVSSTHSNRVAWIFTIRGVRNVWMADGPDFARTARQVTHYKEDDGQSIASVRLTPDGKTVVYALGTELNGAQESANPTSSTSGAKQQVFSVNADAKDAAPQLLGEMGCAEEGCEDIELSPDGKWVLWPAKKKLWLASIDGKQQAKELAVARGSAEEPKWSPDGKHIAFVSDRGGHSLIAVYDFGGSAIRFLAPTVDKDSLPRWSPDGRSLAFVRTAGDQAKLPLIPIRPKPWSIWVADASTGSASVVWQSGEKLDDSLPGLTEDESFKFAAGDRIVFSSEQDGRNHLYAIATSGGTATLLTPGDFDVEQVTLSSDKNSLLYTSNEGDVDRRHLWRVAVAGGTPPNALTSGGRSNGLRSKRVTAKAWFASDRLPGHPRCHT